MTEALEKIARDAAVQVSALLPGSHTQDDGGGEYVSIPVECSNPEEYIIAFVPTLDAGADANWAAENNEHGWSWESANLTASSEPQQVAEWIQSCAHDCASKVQVLSE